MKAVFCLVALLAACASASLTLEGFEKAPTTVSSLNVTQYLGRWYQVYQDPFDEHTFQPHSYCATAEYALDANKTGYISVRNWNRDGAIDGKVKDIFGYAWQPHPTKAPGQLRVVLHGGAPFPAPYWVLGLGPIVNDQYDWAIVSDDLKLTLFILTRDVDRFNAQYNKEVLALVKKMGFKSFLDKPVPVPQSSNCSYAW